jgi:hypothetical protein
VCLPHSLCCTGGRPPPPPPPPSVTEVAPQEEPGSGDQPVNGDEAAGWITVHEPKADWNLSDSDLILFICPRPDWYPYHTFRGPPVPESTAGLDPAGFVLRTIQGVRLHRDGWVVTSDGRAYRADAADKANE